MAALAVLAPLAVLALPPSAAAAESAYTQVLHAFQNHNATVPPCMFSSPELQSALKGQDTYSAQYAGDLTEAIRSALDQRASNACGPKRSSTAVTAKAQAAGPRGAGAPSRGVNPATIPLVSVTGSTSGELPAPIALMAAFALLLALLGALLVVARMRGWDPVWTASWRHAWSEAGYRMASARADLADRLHLRRRQA